MDLGTIYFGVCVNGEKVPIDYGIDVQRSQVRVSKFGWDLASPSDIPEEWKPHLTKVIK